VEVAKSGGMVVKCRSRWMRCREGYSLAYVVRALALLLSERARAAPPQACDTGCAISFLRKYVVFLDVLLNALGGGGEGGDYS
jgi:hypothetical protein